MNENTKNISKFMWKDQYSVKVEQIDNQHKYIIDIINELIQTMNYPPKQATIDSILQKLSTYKEIHFATEEKYFEAFNYEDKDAHILAHRGFDLKLKEIKAAFQNNAIDYAFALVDFLEDWLVDHIITQDQKYVSCFQSHGLK